MLGMDFPSNLKIVALAGGVGGAKMAQGLAHVLGQGTSLGPPSHNLTILVNVGDDFEHFGLKICPDLDTVCYTLAGLSNPVTGWGLKDETWQVIEGVGMLGGPTWFHLGDRDLATHLERTRRLCLGQSLSQVTQAFCQAWKVSPLVLPATDHHVPTIVHTLEGDLSFQEYFVHRKCLPQVTGFTFVDVEKSQPAPGVLEALQAADLIIFAPSNPFVSIDPILAVPGVAQALNDRRKSGAAVLAVSPILGGRTVKGPAAKMFSELGIISSSLAVAQHYVGLLDGFVLDKVDDAFSESVEGLGIKPLVTDTLMTNTDERLRLASEVINFGLYLLRTKRVKMRE
jgi:LPPG:FO 2-phospho-L-lactate transferase